MLGCSYLDGRQWSENEDLWLEYFVGDTLTFVREQHFAPNSIVKVVHEYVPACARDPNVFSSKFAEVDTRDLTFWDQGLAGLHMECVSKDDAEIAVRGWERYLQQEQKAGRGTMHSGVVDWYLIDYILTTGANWRGPIGYFRLEIFDDDPLLISTCFEGLQRVADNRYVFQAHNFVPTEKSIRCGTMRCGDGSFADKLAPHCCRGLYFWSLTQLANSHKKVERMRAFIGIIVAMFWASLSLAQTSLSQAPYSSP